MNDWLNEWCSEWKCQWMNGCNSELMDVTVVYFDQRTHAFTWSKTMKTPWKWSKKYFFHGTQERHIRLTQEHEEKCSFLVFRGDSQMLVDTQIFWKFSSIFHCFRPCEHMRKHAFAGRNTQHVTVNELMELMPTVWSFLVYPAYCSETIVWSSNGVGCRFVSKYWKIC